MTLIINPGSRLPSEPVGWTNTVEQARIEARQWHDGMRRDGFGDDVDLLPDVQPYDEGRWRFTFRHTVTGVTATLDTPGIDNHEAYQRQAIFPARVYWNGSSCASPQLSDFAADGYVQTYRKATER